MKKYRIFPFIILSLGLIGCNSDSETSEIKQSSKTQVNENGEDNELNDDKLYEIGDTSTDEFFTVELLNIVEPKKVIEFAELKITIHDIKIFAATNLTSMADDLRNNFETFGNEDGDYNYTQVQYTVENTSEEDYSWYGFEAFVYNTGEQSDAWYNNTAYSEHHDHYTLYGNVSVEGVASVPFKSDPSDIESIKLVATQVEGPDNFWEEGFQETFEFE